MFMLACDSTASLCRQAKGKVDMEVRRQDIHNSDIPLVCRACEARHGGVCGALTAEQLTELNKHTFRHRLETVAEVIGQGETVVN